MAVKRKCDRVLGRLPVPMVSFLEAGAFSRQTWDRISVSVLFPWRYSHGAYIDIEDDNALSRLPVPRV